MLNDEEIELVEVFKKCLRKMKEHNISFARVDDKSYVFKSDSIKDYSSCNDCKYYVTFLNKFRVKELEWDEGVNKGDWYDGMSVDFK
jgi:predicted Zn-ribbon and HTH transcriptional regulator